MSDNDDWFTEPGWHDFNEPVDPGGAAAGPGAIGPVPASLVSNVTNNASGDPNFDWLHDFTEGSFEPEPVGPPGAGPGPGVSGGVAPVSNTTGPGAPFEVNYAEMEKFAREHQLNAQELAEWASGDPDFPERYLATHGKVNFGTYLKIKEFQASKLAAGTAFAEHNTQTATALLASIASTKATEEANAAAINATRMV